MTTDLAPGSGWLLRGRRVRRAPRVPTADRPGSFTRYLRIAGRRGRRRNASSLRYEVVVALLWFAPGIGIGAWQDLDTAAPVGHPLNPLAAGLVLLAGTSLLGLACAAVGPVSASREWRAWVLSTPLDRTALLRRRTVGVLTLPAVPGLLLGAVVADAAGLRRREALAGALLGLGCAVAAAGLAVWQQRRRRAGRAPGRGWLFSTIGLGLGAVAANLAHIGPLEPAALWWAVGVSAAAALLAGLIGLRGVGSIPLSSLAAGSGSVSSIALAIADQSLSPLSAVLAGPPGRRRTGARTRPLTGTGQRAVLAMDRRRTLRNRAALIRWGAMIVLPYATWSLVGGVGWAPNALVVVTFTSGVAAMSGLCGTVREFAGNPSLADRYGLARAESKRSAMQLPRFGVLLWALGVAPVLLLHTPQEMPVIIGLTVWAVVEFRARQGPFEPKFVAGQQYPQDLGRRFARGPALLLGGAVVLALLTAGLQQRHL